MTRFPLTIRMACGLSLLLSIWATLLPARQPLAKDWPCDVIHLRNGAVWKGLILEESATTLRFQNVRRQPGRPTMLVTASFDKKDLEKIERLAEADRNYLRERIEELDPKGESERRRMESLELQPVEWLGKAKGGLAYESDYFRLVSNAPEEIVRRTAVRLEQVFIAFSRIMPPNVAKQKPTTIHLFHAREDYFKALARRNQSIQNPAFFDPQTNEIFCGSDLKRLGDDLADVRKQNQTRQGELDRQEAELKKLYSKQKADLTRLLQPIHDERKRIAQNDRRNDGVFDQATQQLFAILYHESFHAYLGTWVFPPSGTSHGDLPRWLNEGLAQVFESSLVEAGELRIGHLDREKWQRVKDLIAANQMPSLRAILKTGRDDFVIEHAGQKLNSNASYLASWAFASYLLLERHQISSESLSAYLASPKEGGDCAGAFEKWVGEPTGEFERKFTAWFSKVQPDGSVLQITGR